jgi:AraC-like DNA-binding protein
MLDCPRTVALPSRWIGRGSARTLMTMPVLLEFSGDGVPVRAGRTALAAAREQAAALMTALAPMTRVARLDVPAELAGIRVSRTPVGPVSLIQWRGFDYCQTATAKTSDGVPEGISLVVRPTGRWSLSQAGIIRSSEANDYLSVVDVTRPMRVELDADTALWQMFFSAEQLGLSVDDIRAAAKVIENSPLRQLTASHMLHLPTVDADALPPEALRSMGRATIELVRAMLISAVQPEAHGGDGVSAEALRYAVKQYIQRHLRDPGLSPAAVARAHHISARHLYNVWKDEQVTVARWIGQQRLEAARDDLANPRLAHKSIAAIGREWGYPSPAHFARRFREAHAMSPREWREAARTGW